MSYPKEILKEAGEILAKRREQAALELAGRRAEIAQKLPEAIALEREIASASARLSRAVLAGGDVAKKVDELRAYNLGAQKELALLLKENGYPPDALTQKALCSLCNDTGYQDGKRCGCLNAILKNLMYERLGSMSQAARLGFDNFRLDFYPATPDQSGNIPARVMAKTYSECVRYAEEFCPSSPSLLLTGDPGLGKTHLSLSIASAVVEKGYDALYIPFHTLLGRLEAVRFQRGGEDYRDYLDAPLGAELLVLDDLGAEFTTSFTVSVLYELINARQIFGRPTIINTNLDLRAMEQRYSSRVTSRIIGGYRLLPFIGQDVRLLTTPNR